MNKVLVEALVNFPYDHADRKVGDQFECDPDHARVFNAHGKTKLIDSPLVKEPVFQTADQKAEVPVSLDNNPEQRRNKRYKRRDMRSEE